MLLQIKSNTSPLNLEIMPVKTLDGNGNGDLFDLICGVLYAKNLKVHIINMSLGWQGDSSLILGNAIDNGVDDCGPLFIASAGNEFTDNDEIRHFPSGYFLPNIIEVAAVDAIDGDQAIFNQPYGTGATGHYTNYGSHVDIATVGNWISTSFSNGYVSKEGTSMAAGHISGIAACLKAAQPHANWNTIRTVLLNETANTFSTIPSGFINQDRVVFPFKIADAVLSMADEPTPCATCVGLNEIVTSKHQPLHAYPNPSNGEIYMDFDLKKGGSVEFSVFNSLGQLVDYQEYKLPSGKNELIWNKSKSSNIIQSKGIYFIQINTELEQFIGKIYIQ